MLIRASDFVRGVNIAVGECGNYGTDVILNAAPCTSQPNAAEYDFNIQFGGKYQMIVEYASAGSRPVNITLNGNLVLENALAAATGCWEPKCQQSLEQGIVILRSDKNTLKIERSDVFPHIRSITFRPIK